MKKLICLLVFLILSLSLYSQEGIKWEVLNNDEGSRSFNRVFQLSDEGPRTLFAVPHNKFFGTTKYSIFIRSYNLSMSNFTEFGLPDESPKTFAINGFRDYYVIRGSMAQNSNFDLDGWIKEDNKIVIANNDMVPVVTKNYSLHSNSSGYRYIPEIFVSTDSNYLIVVNSECQNIYNIASSECKAMRYVDVYDKDMNHVWSDSIDAEQIFGKKRNISNFYFDFYDHKLIVSASWENLLFQKEASSIFVLRYDMPGSYQMIMKKEMNYELLSYKTLFTPDGRLIFTGYNINMPAVSVSFGGIQKSQLFFLSVNIDDSGDEPTFKAYEINNEFAGKYESGVKKSLMKSYLLPNQLMFCDGKIFYLCDQLVKTSIGSLDPDITFSFGPLTMMSFDQAGTIQWIQNIEKKTEMKLPSKDPIQFAQAFRSEKGVRVFYYDNAKNVNSLKCKPLGKGLKDRCVVSANVNMEGGIEKSIVTTVAGTTVRADLSQIYSISGNSFLFIGKGTTLRNKGDYYGFYNLKGL